MLLDASMISHKAVLKAVSGFIEEKSIRIRSWHDNMLCGIQRVIVYLVIMTLFGLRCIKKQENVGTQ